jgi:hypothetical protein
VAEAKGRIQLHGFTDCKIRDIFSIDPGDSIMLVIEARKMKTDIKQLLQLSVSSVSELTKFADCLMDFLSAQEDVMVVVRTKKREQ